MFFFEKKYFYHKNLNKIPQKISTDKNGGDCYHLQNIKKCKKRVIKTDVELIE